MTARHIHIDFIDARDLQALDMDALGYDFIDIAQATGMTIHEVRDLIVETEADAVANGERGRLQ